MSEFTWQPAYNASVTKAPRVNTAVFGDGYQQRTADGINTTLQAWQLTFQLAKTDIDAIDAFLVSKGGVASFTWTPGTGAEIKAVCREWSRNMISPRAESLSAKFEQVIE
ncbi:MAG: phage tail protein [Hydrogenophaga sp.]|nr:phage tail protein [Hydrogenophaga sp.]